MRGYGGDYFRAVAAYNAGESAVARWWEGAGGDHATYLERVSYRETRFYLRRVFLNLLQYYRGGKAEPAELLRTLGFAYAPQVLNVLGFIPCVGGIIGIVVLIWTFVAGLIAVREALDIDTGKALITVIVGWLIIFIATIILGTIFGLGAFTLSALTN